MHGYYGDSATKYRLCPGRMRYEQSMSSKVRHARSHCADGATVHRDAGQPVYRDAPGHIS